MKRKNKIKFTVNDLDTTLFQVPTTISLAVSRQDLSLTTIQTLHTTVSNTAVLYVTTSNTTVL